MVLLVVIEKTFFYMELDEACGPVFKVQLKVNTKGWKVWFLIWGSKKDYSEISHIVICFVGSRSAFVCVCVYCYQLTCDAIPILTALCGFNQLNPTRYKQMLHKDVSNP